MDGRRLDKERVAFKGGTRGGGAHNIYKGRNY